MARRDRIGCFLLVVTLSLTVSSCTARADQTHVMPERPGPDASGSFAPTGPPQAPPIRVAAGETCVVDLTQTYEVAGSFSGTFEIDYRIFVEGPCGAPPGTYDERWIAHGTFDGMLYAAESTGSFSYVATVARGGEVAGRIVFGNGITGLLDVRGNFRDGKLSYSGVAR